MWLNRFCHNSISDSTLCPLAYIAVPTLLVSSMNIWSSLHPCAITLSPSSMKHLSWLNHTCIPWSTICPTNTKFLVIVGTCKTFFIHTLLPMWLRGMFSMCLIVWTVLPPVSTNLGCLGVFKLVNYSSWFVIWLEAPESTNNTSPCIDVLASIELAWCFMKNRRSPFDCPVLQT